MPFHAHSSDRPDRSDWEELPLHLERVAALAAEYGKPLRIEAAVRIAGLLHDIGKYDPGFQARLAGSLQRVDHSTAGAAVVLGLAKGTDDTQVAWLIAQAIAGHHAGLADRRSSAGTSLEARLADFTLDRLDAEWRKVLPAEAKGLLPPFAWPDRERLAFQFAMLGRMIFSCLVDADFKATEGFYESIGERRKDRDWPTLAERLPAFLKAFEAKIASFGQPEKHIARLRAEILDTVRERAGMTPGLFTLNVPTGGGKTLASLGFALEHAKRHGHRRIIAAIPFTSIIDQTAAIFREMLGAENVLEHHSAIEDEPRDGNASSRDADSLRGSQEKMRLAMEDWAAPVVVTTHVQLFESLFAARTSRCRKLHNIAGSIVILDEAQTLPRDLLGVSVRAIDELARNYGCSIVLCTATQPAFDARDLPSGHVLGLDLAGRELAPDPPRLARELKRTRLAHAGKMSDEALVEALRAAPQALVIVNSRRHALDLYKRAKAEGLGGLLHMTTRQYAAHRRDILEGVRRRLGEGAPCRLIATSLIEAGVDVDFPAVWRAEAGLDQIAQAAGRCNREGRRKVDDSTVTVFEPADHPPPSEIRGLIGDMARMKDEVEDLFSPDAMTCYFREVYWRAGEALDRKKILADMKFEPRTTGIDVAYRTIAEKYRMIETGMVPVIVARDQAAREAVAKLWTSDVSSGAIARMLQLYVVQTPPAARALLCANGHVDFVNPRERADQFAVLKTDSLYTDEVGLMWENADYAAVENLVT